MATVGVVEHEDGTVQYVCSQCGYTSDNRNRTRGHVSASHRKPTEDPIPLMRESDVIALLDDLRVELERLKRFEAAILAVIDGSIRGQ